MWSFSSMLLIRLHGVLLTSPKINVFVVHVWHFSEINTTFCTSTNGLKIFCLLSITDILLR
jgi:hypothetical protein